jgi:hypothetical protein
MGYNLSIRLIQLHGAGDAAEMAGGLETVLEQVRVDGFFLFESAATH